MTSPLQVQNIGSPHATTELEQRIAQMPENAKAWLRKHPEFITEDARCREIGRAHLDLIAIKGMVPFSPAYFEQVEAKLGLTP
jgi:hypothetical protein